jgi:hypothetical protein
MKLTLVIFSTNDLKYISFPKMISGSRIKIQKEFLGLLLPKREKFLLKTKETRVKLPVTVLSCFDRVGVAEPRHSVPYLGITFSPCHMRIHVSFN